MDEQNKVTVDQTNLAEGDRVVDQNGQEFVKENDELIPAVVGEGDQIIDKGQLTKPQWMTAKMWRELKATGKLYQAPERERGQSFKANDGVEYAVSHSGSIRRTMSKMEARAVRKAMKKAQRGV